MGIYKITNPLGKVYIGQSINITKRFNDYYKLKSDKQILLHRSLLKYGVSNHMFEIVEECELVLLNERERFWQEYYNVLNRKCGLNLKYTESADKRAILSDESKKKISNSNHGKIRSDECKRKISRTLSEYYSKNTHPIVGFKRGTCNNKLSEKEVLLIRNLLLQHIRVVEIAELFNVSKATIQQIKEGRTWRHLGEFIIKGKTSRLRENDIQLLYRLFDLKLKVKEIQKIIPYCITTIAKQRKIWRQMKITE